MVHYHPQHLCVRGNLLPVHFYLVYHRCSSGTIYNRIRGRDPRRYSRVIDFGEYFYGVLYGESIIRIAEENWGVFLAMLWV